MPTAWTAPSDSPARAELAGRGSGRAREPGHHEGSDDARGHHAAAEDEVFPQTPEHGHAGECGGQVGSARHGPGDAKEHVEGGRQDDEAGRDEELGEVVDDDEALVGGVRTPRARRGELFQRVGLGARDHPGRDGGVEIRAAQQGHAVSSASMVRLALV